MEIGQRVIWRYYPQGLAGPAERVSAVVARVGKIKVQIEVSNRSGIGTIKRWVLPSFLELVQEGE